jgi:hypothetical protein
MIVMRDDCCDVGKRKERTRKRRRVFGADFLTRDKDACISKLMEVFFTLGGKPRRSTGRWRHSFSGTQRSRGVSIIFSSTPATLTLLGEYIFLSMSTASNLGIQKGENGKYVI